MANRSKVLLGVVSFVPIASVVALVSGLLAKVAGASLWGVTGSVVAAVFFSWIVLLCVYTVMLARRADVEVAEKIGIPIAIILTNGLILPLVWWLYVWRGSNLASLSKRAA